MTNELIPFDLGEFGKLRYHIDPAGEHQFCCADIARPLGYTSTNITSIFAHVPEEWKGSNPIATPGGPQFMLTVNLNGLLFFLGRSDKPGALPYQMKVSGEIMPSIIKTGRYEAAPVPLSREEQFANAVVLAQQMLAEKDSIIMAKNAVIEVKTAELEAARPDVEFAKRFEGRKSCILISTLGKFIREKVGYQISQDELFDWFRDKGYILSCGSRRHMPSDEMQRDGFMTFNTFTVYEGSARAYDKYTPLITSEGQRYFMDVFARKLKAKLAREAKQALTDATAPSPDRLPAPPTTPEAVPVEAAPPRYRLPAPPTRTVPAPRPTLFPAQADPTKH